MIVAHSTSILLQSATRMRIHGGLYAPSGMLNIADMQNGPHLKRLGLPSSWILLMNVRLHHAILRAVMAPFPCAWRQAGYEKNQKDLDRTNGELSLEFSFLFSVSFTSTVLLFIIIPPADQQLTHLFLKCFFLLVSPSLTLFATNYPV